MPNELTELDVTHISLVKRGANRKRVVLKAGEKVRELRILKEDDELQRVYGIVYAPGEEDAQGDFATAATIKKAADGFMRQARTGNIDKHHNYAPDGAAYVAESWIIRKSDPLFPEETPGAWAVGIQIDSAETWAEFKRGDLGGLSLAGTARSTGGVTPRKSWLSAIFSSKEEPEMPNDEVKKMLDEILAPIDARLASLEKAAQDAQKAEKAAKDEKQGQDSTKAEKGAEKTAQKEIDGNSFAELVTAVKALADGQKELQASVLRKGASESGGGENTNAALSGLL